MKKLCLLAALCGLTTTLLAAGPEWKLVWAEEFNQPGLPDPSRWDYETGFVRNGELQYYTRARKENVRIENGHLILEAIKEKYPNPAYKADGRKEDSKRSREFAEYTSGSITTKGKVTWQYGRIEAMAKIPKGRGMWPAIWMLGDKSDGKGWPACGEIDIMEYVGHEPAVAHGTVHTEKFNHIKKTQKGSTVKVPGLEDAFHLYAIEWTPKEISFFVDDKKYYTFANDGTGDAAWPFDKPFYIILNVAVGGAWGGAKGVDATIFPQRMEVDYVRVYQQK
ncbi:MAG: glycoside hydrolase family 16 protein [Verrucomicrobiota bacterium]